MVSWLVNWLVCPKMKFTEPALWPTGFSLPRNFNHENDQKPLDQNFSVVFLNRKTNKQTKAKQPSQASKQANKQRNKQTKAKTVGFHLCFYHQQTGTQPLIVHPLSFPTGGAGTLATLVVAAAGAFEDERRRRAPFGSKIPGIPKKGKMFPTPVVLPGGFLF